MRLPLLPLLLLPLPALSSILKRASDPDMTGTGKILVIPGKDIQHANTSNQIGCITSTGRFVTDFSKCGTFTQRSGQTMSSSAGSCGFWDPSAEEGRPMAPQGYAFKCSTTNPSPEAFYSFVGDDDSLDAGTGYAWMWRGNLNPYYEALQIPTGSNTGPIWFYTSSDDRLYFMWLWKKLSN